jgi:hypothetical protein
VSEIGEQFAVAQLGNFRPPHSTENHLKAALERLGHHVEPFQENDLGEWDQLCHGGWTRRPALVLWTRTGWDPPVPHDLQIKLLRSMKDWSIPVVGYHLDRWWGLNREEQVHTEPFFKVDLLVTADGDHAEEWHHAGVEHVWMPPGVLLAECEREPRSRPEYRHDVVFVGSWRTYHAEWLPYRRRLVATLQHRYRRRFAVYPRPGHGLRGAELTDLYNNAKVVVGDSCLAPTKSGAPVSMYHSDRLPETVGRGGFLVHPHVEHVTNGALYLPGEHLATYTLGDFDELTSFIDRYLDDDAERDRIRKSGREWVMAEHTYERRMEDLLTLCRGRGLL